MTPLLDVRDLRVSFRTESGLVRAVDGVSFTLEAGHVLGIVGESGSGKSVSVMSIMQLIRDPNAIFEGQVIYKGRDLMGLSQREMRGVRGAEIAMIFQDPMTSLNPVYKVGWQIEEQLHAHEKLAKRAARRRAIELLSAVGIPSASRRIDDYPHQFSGGMRQRVMIAIALACNPDLLIADEPTTALDVTIQAQILTLIESLRSDFGSSVILITHDMGVVAQIAETVAVMYAGQIVEQGVVDDVFASPQHPYTWGLLGSIPRLDRPKPRRLPTIRGLPPSLVELPSGCAFLPRCDHAFAACAVRPELLPRSGSGHLDRCFLTPEQKAELRVADAQAGAA
jgi:oligopeptide/dipeptide ABC transporter ATP-binding protein